MLGCWDVGMGTLERLANSAIGSKLLEIRFPIDDAGFLTVLLVEAFASGISSKRTCMRS